MRNPTKREQAEAIVAVFRQTYPEPSVVSDHEAAKRRGNFRSNPLPHHNRAERLELALAELVTLKFMKDRDGKTDEYLRRQPLAWAAAYEALGAEQD